MFLFFFHRLRGTSEINTMRKKKINQYFFNAPTHVAFIYIHLIKLVMQCNINFHEKAVAKEAKQRWCRDPTGIWNEVKNYSYRPQRSLIGHPAVTALPTEWPLCAVIYKLWRKLFPWIPSSDFFCSRQNDTQDIHPRCLLTWFSSKMTLWIVQI